MADLSLPAVGNDSLRGIHDSLDHTAKAQLNDEHEVQKLLTQLQDYRQLCVRKGMLMEAQLASNRLEELNQQIERKRANAVRNRHIEERRALAEKERFEVDGFNGESSAVFEAYHAQTDEIASLMRQGHEEQLFVWRQHAVEHWELKGRKFSPKLLDLRVIQATLISQKQFGQAAKIKSQADMLEAAEVDVMDKGFEKDLCLKESNRAKRQHKELKSMIQKRKANFEVLFKSRNKQLDRVLQRHQNLSMITKRRHHGERASNKYEPSKSAPSTLQGGFSDANRFTGNTLNNAAPHEHLDENDIKIASALVRDHSLPACLITDEDRVRMAQEEHRHQQRARRTMGRRSGQRGRSKQKARLNAKKTKMFREYLNSIENPVVAKQPLPTHFRV